MLMLIVFAPRCSAMVMRSSRGRPFFLLRQQFSVILSLYPPQRAPSLLSPLLSHHNTSIPVYWDILWHIQYLFYFRSGWCMCMYVLLFFLAVFRSHLLVCAPFSQTRTFSLGGKDARTLAIEARAPSVQCATRCVRSKFCFWRIQ